MAKKLHKGMHHPHHGHKVGEHAKQGGGNLKLPNPSQSMHVAQAKDNMAGNVGGSAAHMSPSAKALPKQKEIQESGSGRMGKLKDKY